ncbi:efflux RND transporter permease subunit [Methylomarinum vadi]|uniref:efflux RND transporter permease subunit n=1 Tax=Methylomarinum vadi TaxID=438855 RepID=UPI0004DF6337|nr:efflux RND transporter permease subunit [Methylomarinum vadi]
MNKLVVIALRRPYTFVVLSILIVLFGIQSVLKTPTDVFPNIKIPVTSVVWAYDGLLPKDVEGRITYIFERFLTSTVEGIKYIQSHSYFGSSIINIFMQDEVELAGAEADIAAIAQTVVKALPPDISPPMIMRLAPSSVPVATLQITSDKLTPAELFNLAIMRIRPLLVTVPGAILPHPYGGQDMQIMVNLDQQKLLARHLTPADVHKALSSQNLVLPGGDQKIQATDWIVLTNASALKLEDFSNIPIKREGNAYIYLHDVADVRLAGRVQTNSVLVDGKQSVMIVVMKSSEASTLEVVDGIKEMIPRIEKVVPESVKIKLINDASTFVKDSISDVVHEMLTAAALVGVIVLLLLGSWRATVIVAATIPLSILASLIVLHAIGQSINVMTLGGLALAVGILVDNATVMIENIDTHQAMGKPLETAIIDAANQIVLPTFVATLAIAIVWFPLFELSGVSGWLFMPMAEAIIFAMLASFLLSFTLLPTMAKYLLVDHNAPEAHPHPGHPEYDKDAEAVYELTNLESEEEALANIRGTHFAEALPDPEYEEERSHHFFGRIQQRFEAGFNRFRERYKNLLERTIAHRGTFVSVSLVLALVSCVLFYFNGRDFFPEIKSGALQMHMRAPLGTRIEVSSRIASLVSKDIAELLPGKVEGVISNCGLPVGPHNLAFIPTPTIGSQDCDLTISLTDEKSPVWDYRRILRQGLKERYPGTEFTFQPSDLTAKILNFGSPAPIDVQINGPDMDDNYEFARKLAGKLRKIPGAADVVIQQTMRTPTMLVKANRSFGLGLNLSQKDFGDNLLMTTAGSQQVDQQYWLDRSTGMSYRINVYTPQAQLTSLNDLLTVPVDKDEGGASKQDPELLGNVAKLSAVGTPGVVTHGNIMPLFDIYVSPEGRDLGAVLEDVEKIAHEMEPDMPHSAELAVHGQAESMRNTFGEMGIGLVAAIVLVYLLIVINFQSWLDPFIIISALPGALAGIAWILFLTHTNLSTPALTGAIMTMGTATANSILVVAYARERFELHGDALKAAIEAGVARIRPVLMTASAMIIGMLPMAIGNSQNAPLGRAVMGGLAVATVFTVLFVPCVYAIIYSRRPARQQETC